MRSATALVVSGACAWVVCAATAAAAPPGHENMAAAPRVADILVAQTPPPAPASGELTGLAAMIALVGNTIVVTDEGDRETAIHFLADGTAKGMDRDKPRTGTWYISGARLCIGEGEKSLSPRSCVTLAVSGASVTLTRPDGRTMSGQVLTGNPRNL